MKKLQFSVEIKAPREKVWNTLWEDKTFRDWASIVDEGTYMVGELKEGSEVQFISSASGYGVRSLVEKYAQNELVIFRHQVDTKDSGEREREKEWTGGTESYLLAENDGVTTLTVDIDVPPGQEETFKVRFPKALERVKILAEKGSKNLPPKKTSSKTCSRGHQFQGSVTCPVCWPGRLKKQHTVYHKDGSIWAKGKMAYGVCEGYWEWFRKDGTKMRSGYFKNGKQIGEWITYDKTGKVYKITTIDK